MRHFSQHTISFTFIMGGFWSRVTSSSSSSKPLSAAYAAMRAEKEKYENMPTAEKRKLYMCREFVTTNDIQTWSQYYEAKKDKLKGAAKEQTRLRKTDAFKVRKDLNEKVSLWKGDITTLEIDAIVNAANNTLMGGGGVDGAIHRAAGGSLLKEECKTLGGCETGDAKMTAGYKLPAKYVMHTVGPIGDDGDSPSKLRGCYSKCLKIMGEEKLKSIAFPCISTGIYGYANDAAAVVALQTTRAWLEKNHATVDRVIFCLFMPLDVRLYETYMQKFFPVEEPGEETEPEEASGKPKTKRVEEQGKEQESKRMSIDGETDSKPTAESEPAKDSKNGAKQESSPEKKKEETSPEDFKAEMMETDSQESKDKEASTESEIKKESKESLSNDEEKSAEKSAQSTEPTKTEGEEAKKTVVKTEDNTEEKGAEPMDMKEVESEKTEEPKKDDKKMNKSDLTRPPIRDSPPTQSSAL